MKIIRRNKGANSKSPVDDMMSTTQMRKYMVTTITRKKDGSKQISTSYKPEIPLIQTHDNITDSMKMLTEANFPSFQHVNPDRPKSCLMIQGNKKVSQDDKTAQMISQFVDLTSIATI
jgi:hypothetical protein